MVAIAVASPEKNMHIRTCAAVLGFVVLFAWPVPARGWGMDVHRWITGRAIDGLPAGLRAFFGAKREFISEHSVDPDLWRVVGLKGPLGEEDPNHYLDIDGLDEPAPYLNVPRDWDAFVARYGVDRANRMGRLPWRTEEIYGKLVNAFRDIGRGTAPYAADNSRYLVAVLAHYIEDAHVPFHAVLNHDGQLTGQRGIHSRFESELVLRYLARLAPKPVAVRPVPNIKEFIFETLVRSAGLVPDVLAADRAAAGAHPKYDEAYYDAFFKGAGPIAELRLGDAASGLASAIVSAWDAAGRPALPVAPIRGGLR
jgi:alkylated DNA nucleotide flippase Atl1